MPVPQDRPKLYVVRFKGSGYSGGYGGRRPRFEAVFADRSAAEQHRLSCERSFRPTVRDNDLFWKDPHHSVSPLELTNFDLPIFLDWLLDADIPVPPAFDKKHWLKWWDQQRERLTGEQLFHLFEGLHKLSFYEIREVDWIDEETGWTAEGEWTRETAKPFPDVADQAAENWPPPDWMEDVPLEEFLEESFPEESANRDDEIPF